ncbi:MAG TPA: right-handed parallel beta-helix repeat-containing protein [Candidatus Polarisedimenticolaceae bacterium]|nr:right-handed parallel beta-helix repeat-containing protein [Candidatus Polarisedimenticolaceae bacterium]
MSSSSNRLPIAIVLLLICPIVAVAHAAEIHVDASNMSGMEDGSPAFPYTTIQQGIVHAAAGDKVRVAAGVYKEAVLMTDGVSVIGAGWRTTFIDATGLSASAVVFDATRLSPLLSGFTITGGEGDQRSEIGDDPVTFGGGILILDSSPLILDNRIVANVVEEGHCFGGGIYVSAQNSAPQIRGNIISGNTAESLTIPGNGRGGAIFASVKDGSVTIEQNVIETNRAIDGGGIVIENLSGAAATIRRNRLIGNRGKFGAAVWLMDADDSTTEVANNLFVDNGSAQAGARGAGVLAFSSANGFFRIINNTFADNALDQGDGAALALDDSQAIVTDALVANNIVYQNEALTGGGIEYTAFGGTIRSNALFANAGGDLYEAGGSTATLIGNVVADPGLAGTAINPYRLSSTSPLIDSAADDVSPSDDLDGLSRPFDGDGDLTAAADFGASEFPARTIDGVRFLSSVEIEWDAELADVSYQLYRGSLAVLRATGNYTQDPISEPLAARDCDLLPSDLPVVDGFAPPPSVALFYLVSLEIGAYTGGLGLGPDGYERPNAFTCP